MSARDVKGAVNDAIGKSLLRGDWPSERADTVLAALDAAGYAVVPKAEIGGVDESYAQQRFETPETAAKESK